MCTDACCEPRPDGETPFMGLGYVLLDSARSIRRGGTVVLSRDIIRSFNEQTQYMALGEAFAPLLALWHERDILQGSSVLLFIDNLSLLSALCKGSSAVSDFG